MPGKEEKESEAFLHAVSTSQIHLRSDIIIKHAVHHSEELRLLKWFTATLPLIAYMYLDAVVSHSKLAQTLRGQLKARGTASLVVAARFLGYMLGTPVVCSAQTQISM